MIGARARRSSRAAGRGGSTRPASRSASSRAASPGRSSSARPAPAACRRGSSSRSPSGSARRRRSSSSASAGSAVGLRARGLLVRAGGVLVALLGVLFLLRGLGCSGDVRARPPPGLAPLRPLPPRLPRARGGPRRRSAAPSGSSAAAAAAASTGSSRRRGSRPTTRRAAGTSRARRWGTARRRSISPRSATRSATPRAARRGRALRRRDPLRLLRLAERAAPAPDARRARGARELRDAPRPRPLGSRARRPRDASSRRIRAAGLRPEALVRDGAGGGAARRDEGPPRPARHRRVPRLAAHDLPGGALRRVLPGDRRGHAPAAGVDLARAHAAGPTSTPARRSSARTWAGLRRGAPGMDALVAIGAGAALAYSVWQMLRGGEVYFDTAAMIPTLVLVGRYVEAGAKGRASEAVARLAALAPREARRLERGAGGRDERRAVAGRRRSRRATGSRWSRASGSRSTGAVRRATSEVDESLVTGESRPVAKRPGRGGDRRDGQPARRARRRGDPRRQGDGARRDRPRRRGGAGGEAAHPGGGRPGGRGLRPGRCCCSPPATFAWWRAARRAARRRRS